MSHPVTGPPSGTPAPAATEAPAARASGTAGPHRQARRDWKNQYLMDEEGNITGKYAAPEYDFASVLCVEKVLPTQAAFIRRSALEQVGLRADATLDTCPDYEMFVRLGLRFPMRHVRDFVARYRFYERPMDGAHPRGDS